jgi:hypothetical protein
MSVTILQQPGEITFSKNPVIFRFQALDANMMPYRAKGTSAYMRFDTEGPFVDEEYLTTNIIDPDGIDLNAPVSFVFKNTPTADFHLPANPANYNSFTDYLQAIADKLNAHPQFGPYFRSYIVINGTDKRVWSEAKDTHPDWEIQWGSDVSGITTGFLPATQTNLPDDYKIRVEVFVEREYLAGFTTPPVIVEGIPNDESEVCFDISGILHREGVIGLSDPPLPVFNSDDPQLADILRRYAVRYMEVGQDVAPVYIGPKYFLLGGIAQNLFARADFFANLSITNSLLSWYPNGKTVGTDQPEYLAWYNYTTSDKQIVLQLTRFPESNIDKTILYAYDTPQKITVKPKETLLIPCGWAQLKSALSLPDTDVVKYVVRVVDAASGWESGSPGYLSQTRRFYIDTKYRHETRYIQYLNGFYCPQSLRCIGNFSEDIEVEREETTRVLTPNYTETTAETFQNSETWEDLFTYRTGYFTKAEVHALQELLVYGKAWEVYAEGYIPLVLKGKKFAMHESRQNLYSLSVECSPALSRRNYSNIMIPMEADENGWRIVPEGYWKTVFGNNWGIV